MSDVTAGVVLVSKFVPAGHKKFKGYIDYIDRDSAVRNETVTEYSIDSLQDELNKFENYTDYMANPHKTSELFTAKKDKLTDEEKAKLKNVFEMAQDNGSLMWQTVISFDNRWLAEQGIYDLETRTVNEAKLKECARGAMARIIEQEHLAASAMWSGAIHYNTNHLHIHLAMVEAFPTREIIKNGIYAGERKGKFKQATLERAKSFVVNNILSQKQSNQSINDIIRHSLVAAMQDNDIYNNIELRNLYLNIYQQLPKNKRLWQYNRNVIKPVRKDIDHFITEWIEKNHKEDFEKLKQELQQQQMVYQTAYGSRKDKSKSNYAENKIKELYARLGNTILTQLKTLDATDDIELLEPIVSDEAIDNDILDNDFDSAVWDYSTEQYNNYPTEDFKNVSSDLDSYLLADLADLFSPAPKKLFAERTKKYKAAKVIQYQIKPNESMPDFKTAFELMSAEAATGNIYAIFDLAYLYSKGLGCKADSDKANKLYYIALRGFNEEIEKIKANTTISSKQKNSKLTYLYYRAAKMYYYGLGTETDKQQAYDLFNLSDSLSPDGYIFSRYYIARFYEQGEVVAKNIETAFSLYKEIADKTLDINKKQKMPFAVYKVGKMYEDGQGTMENLQKSEEYYSAALSLFLDSNTKQPDDQLQYRIGKMYLDGKGTDVDIEKAKAFLSSAAKMGNDMANYTLAMIYLKYEDNPDPAIIQKAMDMLKLSANPDKQNNALAQYQLGSIYLKQFDDKQARYYLTLSAEQNNQYAQYKLGNYLIKLTNPEDVKKGLSYLYQSAEQGNIFAKYSLGTYLMKKPNKTEMDVFDALKFFNEAAQEKNCFASYQLGKIYLAGDDVGQDCLKAEKFLLKALHDRDKTLESFSSIEHMLGKLYFNGGGNFEINTEKGMYYYLKAAEQGNQYSQYALGTIYFYGLNGIEKDLDKARLYLSQSAEQGNERATLLLAKLNAPKIEYLKPLYLNLDMNNNFSNLLRNLGREYKTYENYVNQQIYEQMENETEAEN